MHHFFRINSLLLAAVLCSTAFAADTKAPAEQALEATNGVKVIVRAQGPYDADVPLQVVCYFKHKPTGDKTQGAPVELDKQLGGVITSLRNRGEFTGDDQEVLLLTVPTGTIKPKLLLLIGLGEESKLSQGTMERVGRTALRQASHLGATKVAFAPLLRDQGNNTLAIGDVETSVIRGMLLAYDTHLRLQKEGLAKNYALEEWIVEAGPAFFQDTIKGVEAGIAAAKKASGERSNLPYTTKQN